MSAPFKGSYYEAEKKRMIEKMTSECFLQEQKMCAAIIAVIAYHYEYDVHDFDDFDVDQVLKEAGELL